MKILIVEDDFTSRLLLQEFLKSFGVSHIAVNGKEAIEAVRIALDIGAPYDLICLDVMMPDMDGLHALEHIRAMENTKGIDESKQAKIIMTTSLADTHTVIKARQLKCNAYLTKPVEQSVLLKKLRDIRLIS